MAIFDTVSEQIKVALKAKDETRLAALRSIRAAFLNECKKDNSTTLADDVAVSLLRKLEKQRQESIDAFANAGATWAMHSFLPGEPVTDVLEYVDQEHPGR